MQRERKVEWVEGRCRRLESQTGAQTGKVFPPCLGVGGGGAQFQYFTIDVTTSSLHYTNDTLEIHIFIKMF